MVKVRNESEMIRGVTNKMGMIWSVAKKDLDNQLGLMR